MICCLGKPGFLGIEDRRSADSLGNKLTQTQDHETQGKGRWERLLQIGAG